MSEERTTKRVELKAPDPIRMTAAEVMQAAERGCLMLLLRNPDARVEFRGIIQLVERQ